MKKIIIEDKYCPKNHKCPVISKCPVNAITQKSINHVPEVDNELCINCEICTKFCNTFVCIGCNN